MSKISWATVHKLEMQFQTSNGINGGLCQKMDKARKKEVDTLWEWVKAVRSLIQIWIRKLKRSMSTKATSVFKILHRKLNVVVPADKAPNNIVLISKSDYVDCLHLGLNSTQGGNPTYTATTLSKDEIIDKHMSVFSSFWAFHER